MPSRNNESILFNVFLFIFGAIVYAFIVSTVTLQPFSVFPLIILGATFGAIVIAWYQHGVRTRMLALSQRFAIYFIIPPLIGIALGLLAITIIVLVRPYVAFLADVSFLWVEAGAGGAFFILATFIAEIVCWRLNRMDITASRCYYVVRKVDRLSAQTEYYFERNATFQAIRREARILDQLARRRNACIKHSFPLSYSIVPGRDFLQRLNTDTLRREKQLATYANLLWREGARSPWRRWHKYGSRVKPLQFHKIFGSKLDDLFNYTRGFRIYDTGGPRFVTVVIKGPPGAGKSTQALQMCVSLACQGNFCMYYSMEEEREGLLKSAQAYGWDNPEEPPYNEKGEAVLPGAQAPDGARKANYRGVLHASFERSRSQLKERQETLKKQVSGNQPQMPAETSGGVVLVSSLGGRAMSFHDRMGRLRKVWGGRLGNTGDLPEVARCVVIDSLEGFANIGLEHEGQFAVPRDELIALKDFFRDRCQLLVIVSEDDGSGKAGYVDFVADMVIQLGRRADSKTEYTILTIEVLKARNQKHSLGQHQIKIVSKDDIENATGAAVQVVHNTVPGVQVLPSLHYHLSLSSREETFDEHFLSIGLAGLDEMFNSDPDFDKKRGSQDRLKGDSLIPLDQLRLRRPSATALLGPGGTAKSMIATNFLIEGIRENTRTLLLSFRDDEGTLINRPIAQDGGRMRFSFTPGTRSKANAKVDAHAYFHRFEWTIDDIARWVRSGQQRARLPYLFSQGPASYEAFQKDQDLQAEALATQAFLERLGATCPADQVWMDSTRALLQHVYDEAWKALQAQMAESLTLVAPGVPKILRLESNSDKPRLVWDSQYMNPDAKARESTPLLPNTELLRILALRPGNITPEDVIARILRIIGDTGDNRQYERVVFDDVSQLQHGFPLLANSQLFLRALIDVFKAKGMTSLFIADTADAREDDLDHGLADMADHVLRTQVQYLSDEGKLSEDGDYSQRVIVIELEGRPGFKQQAPHTLKVNKSNIVEMARLP